MNAASGQSVPLEVDWLIGRLSLESSDIEKVVDGAFLIFAGWLAHKHRRDNKGFRLHGKIRRRAEIVQASDGPTEQLKRLEATAKGGSEKEFAKRWLATSGFVAKLVSPRPQPMTREYQDGKLVALHRKPFDTSGWKLVKAGGLTGLIPTAEKALPWIEDALAKLGAMSPGKIKELRAEGVEITHAQFVGIIRDVYARLTGEAGVSYSNSDSRLRHTRLTSLWSDIDKELGTDTFGKPSRVRKPIKKPGKK